MNRLEEPTTGTVELDGRDVTSIDPVTLRRGLGYVIQSGGLFPHLTIAENVGLLPRIEGWSPDRVRSRVDALLELVALDPAEFRDRRPAELSGGQQQRVGVARALALDPSHLLMDEPFGALDPITRLQLQRDFSSRETLSGKTILLVTHDVHEAFALADRLTLMDAGRVVQTGTPDELRDDPTDDFVRLFFEAQLLRSPKEPR